MICGKETHANGELLKSIIHTSKFVPAKSSAQTNTKGRYGTMLFASHTGWKTPNSALWLSICLY